MTRQKVYMAYGRDEEYFGFIGIFSTKEKALDAINKYNSYEDYEGNITMEKIERGNYYKIRECEIDKYDADEYEVIE